MNRRGRESDHEVELERLNPPAGWVIRRRGKRSWWVYRQEHVVAELGVLFSGEWWVCPEDEVLPWARTYPSAAEAIEGVVAWWQVTRPFG